MSRYLQQIEKARLSNLRDKSYLTDIEGCVYTSLGRSYFKKWAAENGCRLRIGRRVVYDRAAIDKALQSAKG